MKAEIAVVTVSGKAYYLIVKELKRRNIPFLSLTPNEEVPLEIKVVITTEEEQNLIAHGEVLTLRNGMPLETVVNLALQMASGKEYGKIVIGVDPGEVFGLAVLADGKVVETCNCFSIEETLEKIKNILGNLKVNPSTSISVSDLGWVGGDQFDGMGLRGLVNFMCRRLALLFLPSLGLHSRVMMAWTTNS